MHKLYIKFHHVLTLLMIILIMAYVFLLIFANLTEGQQKFVDICLGLLLAKLGTIIDFWFGAAKLPQPPLPKPSST